MRNEVLMSRRLWIAKGGAGNQERQIRSGTLLRARVSSNARIEPNWTRSLHVSGGRRTPPLAKGGGTRRLHDRDGEADCNSTEREWHGSCSLRHRWMRRRKFASRPVSPMDAASSTRRNLSECEGRLAQSPT